jgi:hypothetical protein
MSTPEGAAARLAGYGLALWAIPLYGDGTVFDRVTVNRDLMPRSSDRSIFHLAFSLPTPVSTEDVPRSRILV